MNIPEEIQVRNNENNLTSTINSSKHTEFFMYES